MTSAVPKIAIIGDSLLKGIPAEGKRYQTVCYRGLTIERLQDKIIRGILDQNLDSCTVVVIAVGTNNLATLSTDQLISGLLNLVSLIKSRVRGKTVKLCGLLPRLDKDKEHPNVNLNKACRSANKALKRACAQNQIEHIKTYKAFIKNKQIRTHLFVNDGLHLSKSGSLALQRSILSKV